MATIKEVADYAAVSVATVSRVINKTGYVSQDLQQRVYDAMATLNYKPSALAQSLRSQRTQVIGVLIPQLDQPFFSALTFSIEKALFASDYRTLICSSEESRDKEDSYIDMLMRQRVDGVILAPMQDSSANVKNLLERNIPVVIVDRDLPELTNVNRVLTDNFQGAYDGMRHLLEIGHRRIGILSPPLKGDVMLQRIDGARKALSDFGIEKDETLVDIGTQEQYDTGYNGARVLLDVPHPPTAIFALTDMMAVEVIHTSALLGLKLPDDLSIVGFDNIPLAAHIVPELTTVAQPIYQIGRTAAQLLLQQIQDPNAATSNVILRDELIIRKSTTPYKEK
jgi:LacI family transcriptional regulator